MKKTVRTIVIDDERLARLEIRRLLKDFPAIEVVSEASNIAEAVEEINTHKPDLLFLDIQLRSENGFDLLDKINFTGSVIFVTAFDQYAVRAFEVNALDYLLKPVDKHRLEKSLEKIKNKKPKAQSKTPISNPNDLIFLKFNDSLRFVKQSNILKIVADGSYSKIYLTDNASCMMSKPLKYWENRLPESQFIRIHRSVVINLEHIQNINKSPNYSYKIILKYTGEEILSSRRYAIKLREQFK